jgi:hypothetical protein
MSNPSLHLELSGPQWVKRFPTSVSVDHLRPPFKSYVRNFLNALYHATDHVEGADKAHSHISTRHTEVIHAEHPPGPGEQQTVPYHVQHAHSHRHPKHHGVHVSIAATFRPAERAYLMHYAYLIAREDFDPRKVKPMHGVHIQWVHPDATGKPDLMASRNAAEEMVRGYAIKYEPALVSRHTEGLAIDMTITWVGTLEIRDSGGFPYRIHSTPRTGAGNRQLHEVGATFGVHKLLRDPPHWSIDGH